MQQAGHKNGGKFRGVGQAAAPEQGAGRMGHAAGVGGGKRAFGVDDLGKQPAYFQQLLRAQAFLGGDLAQMPEHGLRAPALFRDFPVPGQSVQGLQITGSAKTLHLSSEALGFLGAQEDVQPVRQMDEVAQAGVVVMAGRVPGRMMVEDHVADGPGQTGGFTERPTRPAVGALIDFENQIPGFCFHGHRADIVQNGGGQQTGTGTAVITQLFRHTQTQPGHARMVSGQRRRHNVQRCG